MAIHSVELTSGKQFYVEAAANATQAELEQLLREGRGLAVPSAQPQEATGPSAAEQLAKIRADRRAEINKPLPEAPPEDAGNALTRGLDRGIDVSQLHLGSVVEGIGSLLGLDHVEELGAGIISRNQAELDLVEDYATRLDDVEGVGSGLSYLGEIAGESAPAMGAAITGGAIGTLVLPGVGTAIGAGIGAALATFPLFYGGNRERQKEAIERGERVEISEGAAALTAIPQAAADSILTVLGAKFFLKPAAEVGGGLLTRAATGAGKGALIEVPTEIGQSALERLQAGLPIADAEAIREYGEVGLAAGLLGSSIGGAAGVVGPRGESVTGTKEQEEQQALEDRGRLDEYTAFIENLPENATLKPEFLAEYERLRGKVEEYEQLRGEVEGLGATEEELAALSTDEQNELLGISPQPILGVEEQQALEDRRLLDQYIDVIENLPENATLKPEFMEEYERLKLKVEGAADVTDTGTEPDASGAGLSALGQDVDGDPKSGIAGLAPAEVSAKGVSASGIGGLGSSKLESGPAAAAEGTQSDPLTPEERAFVEFYEQFPLPNNKEQYERLKLKENKGATELVDLLKQADAVTLPIEGEQQGPAPKSEALETLKQSIDEESKPFIDAGGNILPLPSLADLGGRADAVSKIREKRKQDLRNPIGGKVTGTANQVIPGMIYPTDKETLKRTGKPYAESDPALAPPNRRATEEQAEIKPAEFIDNRPQERLDAAFLSRLGSDPDLAHVSETDAGADTQGGDVKTLKGVKYNKDTKQEEVVTLELGVDEDTTTPADRTAVANLLESKPKDKDAKTAQKFFKRYRRPADALQAIGVALRAGKRKPNKKITITDTAGKKEVLDAYKTDAEYTFFEAVNTVDQGVAAQRWVEANMSTEGAKYISRGSQAMTKGTSLKAQEALTAGADVDKALTKQSKMGAEARKVETDESKATNKQIKAEFARKEKEARLEEQTAVKGAPKKVSTAEADKRLRSPEFSEVSKAVDKRFEAYLRDPNRMGFTDAELEAMPAEEKNSYKDQFHQDEALKKLALEDYGFVLELPRNDVSTLSKPLSAAGKKAIRAGNLTQALNSVTGSPAVKALAKKMAAVVGTTKVKIVKDLKGSGGLPAAGTFDPQTNTISLDAKNGLNAHVLIHEMGHAVLSASLADPKAGTTKEANKIYEAVRDQMGGVYGTTSLDEFASEYLSNPEFNADLHRMRMGKDGKYTRVGSNFANLIRKIFRRIFKYPPETAGGKIDALLNSIMAPSPEYRSAPVYNMAASTPKGAEALIKSILDNKTTEPLTSSDRLKDLVNDRSSKTKRIASNFVLKFLDSRILTDLAAGKGIPFARDLHNLILEQTGELRSRLERIDSLTARVQEFRKNNPAGFKLLDYLASTSTYLKVDPSLPRSTYDSFSLSYLDKKNNKAVFKSYRTKDERDAKLKELNTNKPDTRMKAYRAGDPDLDKMADWDTLHTLYESKELSKTGRELYRTARNFYREVYDEIPMALESRINSATDDPAQRKSAFEKITELIQKESGLIRPYFPLGRKGEWRLEYNATDPMSKKVEYFVEYFQSESQAKRAAAAVTVYNSKATSTDPTLKAAPILSLAATPRQTKAYPPSSFVYEILQTLKANGVTDTKVLDQILEISLDAMPERSFMQGFRARKTLEDGKGVRGFIGDITPTSGIGTQQFDFADMLKSKGRDFTRQLVQLKSGAKIQEFVRRLKDPKQTYTTAEDTKDMANTLLTIAEFAQSPNVARWSQMATSLGFNWTMGANFSSAAITFFDVGMSAMPILSGRFGINNTVSAYRIAGKLLIGAPKDRIIEVTGADGKLVKETIHMGVQGKSMANYGTTLPKALDYIKYLAEAGQNKGQFNQSMTQEQLEIGRDAPMETINKYTSFMFHHSERINRETTLTASYILKVQQMAGGKDPNSLTEAQYQEAADFAVAETEYVLGSAASAGRPVFAQNDIGNILFLFKRFAVSKYYMMYRMVKDSTDLKTLKARGLTEKQALLERTIARKQFARFLITTGLASGVGGMPLMGVFGAIYNLLRDPYEDDFESEIRKMVGGGFYDGLANQILGVDVASRISMNSLLYRKPMIDKDQDPLWTLAEQVGGPVLGVYLSASRAVSNDFMTGEYRRGVEGLMPAAVRSFLKAERYNREGVETRRGDPIVGELSAYNVLTQGIGFTPETDDAPLATLRKINNNERRKQEAINSDRHTLLKRLNMARREGDRDGMREALKDIREFNKSLPATARKSIITTAGKGSTVERSRKSFGNTSDKISGGMTYTPFMRASAKEFNTSIFE